MCVFYFGLQSGDKNICCYCTDASLTLAVKLCAKNDIA